MRPARRPILVAFVQLVALAACAGPAAGPTRPQRTAPSPTAIRSEGLSGDAGPSAEQRPDLPSGRPLRAGFLIVEGVYDTELAAPYDVFQHTRYHAEGRPPIEVFTVSPDGRSVRSFEGLSLTPDHSFADAPPIDILVVPSAAGSMDRDLRNAALVDWVRRVGGQARFVLSLCDGAFVLAQAGLLDGRAATTFPADYDRFARLFPAVDLKVNVSFVHDGKALTSEGGARSYDAAMYLVDLLYGRETAQGIGRGLLVPWPPHLDQGPRYIVESRSVQDRKGPD